MKKLIFVFSILFFIQSGFSQKKELSLKSAYTDYEIYPVSIRNLSWTANPDYFSYVESQSIIKESIKGKAEGVLSIAKFNKALKVLNIDEQRRFPSIDWINDNEFEFILQDKIISFNIKSNEAKILNKYKSSSEYIKVASNNNVAFTEGQELHCYINGNLVEVTENSKEGVVNGQTVHRSEFGITHGIFWSPKGNKLAFYKKDESMVKNYPLVDISGVAELSNTRYPMAGTKSEEVELHIYDIKSTKTIKVKTEGPKEQYLTAVTWSPDEKFIYIGVLNRDQNHLKLNKYNAENGNFIKTLFEEKHDKYVEPEHQLQFLNNTSDKFVWFSERDGFNHLYLYNTEGEMIKQLTKGEWVVTEFLGFDEDNENVYFISTKESPLERHLYSVNLKNMKMKKLTDIEGTHNVMLNKDKSYFIDVYSNYKNIAREYALYKTKGKKVRILKENVSPLDKFKVGELTISSLKADDGTDLYYKMYKPHDFDENKKYPVVIYVYGGPHAQLVTNSWTGGGYFFPYYLANQGYIVFTLDNRGSANRGFEFESSVFRNLGQLEMKDQMKGVEYLKSLPFVDNDKIGAYGWSYGGYMTTSLMTNYNDVFKVGVAGGPVIDWKYYEVMYGERYMDTPEDNPEGYEKTSLLNKAKDLKGQLLIVHGTMDPTVVWQHSLKFLELCIQNEILVDYFVYPGHEHNVRGYDRVHLNRKIVKYFNDYLK